MEATRHAEMMLRRPHADVVLTRLEFDLVLGLRHQEDPFGRQLEVICEFRRFARVVAAFDHELEERSRLLAKPSKRLFLHSTRSRLAAPFELR